MTAKRKAKPKKTKSAKRKVAEKAEVKDKKARTKAKKKQFEVEFYRDWCKGCGICSAFCPEEVLAMCDHQIKQGKRVRLSSQAREAILAENERMAGAALRVLGVAYRELDDDSMPTETEQLVWLGLAGMADPMRPGMDKLIAKYHRAGIETIMITGDQSATASAIGHQLGLSQGRPLQVLESSKLEDMDPALLAGLVKNIHVFARVSPAHKLKIVQALQDAGYVVAMTGDGINDGPALKAADIGVEWRIKYDGRPEQGSADHASARQQLRACRNCRINRRA